MTDDRELPRFLYRLTQEIVTSRDYTDNNINKICDKYCADSAYPDKERLRRLVLELKRKLTIGAESLPQGSVQQVQLEDVPHHSSCPKIHQESVQHVQLEDFPHRISCPHYSSAQMVTCPAVETLSDKCVGTQSLIFPTVRSLVNDETQYQEQLESYHTFGSTSACNMSTCTACSQVPSKHSIEDKSVRNLSEESVNLIEQLLMKHAGTTETSSSEILLRMAAANRALQADSGRGKSPHHPCDQPAEDAGGSECRNLERKFTASGGANSVPILRQEPEEGNSTPSTTCCGTNRKKGTHMQGKQRKQV
ncbi:uncharacterized protein LOC129766987 [Toxorhynchites rutilus septentrionalis]|uniref:uncharacterized protein LOC129766987 n=1 Tax=Toxorhynchites rutilus septentrionalis TaxID=329112 RepID=UPI002478CA4E|nr:uncharacterized protein LOC129766987 [Toxorhynchites rutilus septentrionalis]